MYLSHDVDNLLDHDPIFVNFSLKKQYISQLSVFTACFVAQANETELSNYRSVLIENLNCINILTRVCDDWFYFSGTGSPGTRVVPDKGPLNVCVCVCDDWSKFSSDFLTYLLVWLLVCSVVFRINFQEQYVCVHDAVVIMFTRQLELMLAHNDYYNCVPKLSTVSDSRFLYLFIRFIYMTQFSVL